MDLPLNSDEKFRALPISVLALLLVLAAPTFWKTVELDSAVVPHAAENQDLYEYYVPTYEGAYGRIRSGAFPQWDVSRFCGAPLVGDPRLGFFQPLHLVFLLAPFPEAFAIHAFTCLAAAGIAFVLFARSMGLSLTAALFGALCFAFSGAAAGAMSRPPLAAAIAWLPIVMWSAGALARRPRWDASMFFGLALSGLLLSGALAVFAIMALVATAYVLVRAIFPSAKRPRLVARSISGLIFGLLICGCVCAAFIAPVVAFGATLADPAALARTVFPIGTLPSSLREAAAQFIAPQPANVPFLMNIGIVSVFVLPAALFRGRLFVESACFLTVAVGLGVSAILYGDYFPAALPPHAAVYPAVTCAAAACTLGVDRLLRIRSGPGRGSYWFAAGITICTCVAVFLFGNSLTRGYATIVAAIVVAMLFVQRPWIRAAFGITLCGLSWTYLLTSSQNTFGHPVATVAPVTGSEQSSWQTFAELESGRLAIVGEGTRSIPDSALKLPRVEGHGALMKEDQAEWWRALTGEDNPNGSLTSLPDLKLLAAMAGSVVLAADERAEEAPALRWTAADNGRQYCLVESVAPRAFWVGRLEWTEGIEDTISQIQSSENIRNLAFIDSRYQSSAGLQDLEGADADGGGATASVQDRSPEHVVVTVKAPSRGLVVLADTHAPGWTATLDGQPATIVPVNGLFRGVPVPSGDHIVEFRYQNLPLLAGGVISLTTLVLLALLALYRLMR